MSHDGMSNMQAYGFHGLMLLGSGTQGRVYSSFDEKLQHMVVVKTIDASTPSQQDGLKKEIIALRKYTHPNIVPLLYALLRPHVTLIVTPLGRGNIRTLMPMRYDLVDQSSTLYTMTVQMLSALDFLEREGVSHGNIKPTNVLVEKITRSGHRVFQLVDFAYAEGTYEAPPHCPHAPAVYKAPEAFDGSYPLGPKGDVWSLFVTLAVACGRLSEAELFQKGPVLAFRDIVEAAVQMPELEGMARQYPTLRASAREMLACLSPESLDVEVGEAGRAEFNDLDVCGYIDGSCDLPLSSPVSHASPASGLPNSEQYTHLPPINNSSEVFPTTTTRNPIILQPPFSPPFPTRKPRAQRPQQHQAVESHPVGQRCLESCCNTPRSLASSTTTSATASILTSVSLTAGLAPYKPLSPVAPSFFPVSSTRQRPATQQVSLTETWNIWGVGDSRNSSMNSVDDANRTIDPHHHHHHHHYHHLHYHPHGHVHATDNNHDNNHSLRPLVMSRPWDYIPPYPIACDSPPEQEDEEDSQSLSEGESSWSDSGLGCEPEESEQ
ncbi:hypothetical protein TgHK011_007203 [Trichoderma gracile]|nr:hypothetical protein TgHK011_007203 [Trichoderma gracile]